MTENRYGVLIANSRYPKEPKLAELRCPENDVDGINEVLSSKTYGNYTQTHVLKNCPSHEVLEKINEVLKEARKNDMVLIYYSGHGKLDAANRLHLATLNTKINLLESTSIPVQSIKNYIDISPSNKIILILDCCFSGAAGKAFTRGGVDDHLHQVSESRGIYVMTASTGIQVAREKESDQYGVLTKYILEGIREGTADENSDGLIDIDELYHYVYPRVKAEGCQEPMMWDIDRRGGQLIVSGTGKPPREDRGKRIKDELLRLSGEGVLPDSILAAALKTIPLNPAQMTEDQKQRDDLLDLLEQKEIPSGMFIEKWYKLRPDPPTLDERKTKKQQKEKGVSCPKCGRSNNALARFCQVCGTDLVEGTRAKKAKTKTPRKAHEKEVQSTTYAGFWKRAGAGFIDGFLTNFVSVVLLVILDEVFRLSNDEESFTMFILQILITWLYFANMESSSKQATFGKRALKIVVTDLNGNKLSFGQATKRHFSKIISGVILGVGFFMVGATEKKQALHDKMAGCLVIDKPSSD